jgi:hypothetical protein
MVTAERRISHAEWPAVDRDGRRDRDACRYRNGDRGCDPDAALTLRALAWC